MESPNLSILPSEFSCDSRSSPQIITRRPQTGGAVRWNAPPPLPSMASSAICGARHGKGGGNADVSEADVRARLAAVNTIYPGTNICCVMAPTGTVLCVVRPAALRFAPVAATEIC